MAKVTKVYLATSNDNDLTLGSGEPPGGDELDSRVQKLEGDLKEIKGDLKALVKDVAEIKGRVSAMPSSFQLLGMVLAIMGATFAFIRFGLSGL
ncbi:hypothetical protein [Neorhizobium sp. T6_25]|uniref:hypothetical protein n=1 Tax=Neorhizobium sp. T6_25 TaxID=2093833 RepID=UPI000CF872E8|nr:hypothetical protein [Neorhizobium sp. T6_25]